MNKIKLSQILTILFIIGIFNSCSNDDSLNNDLENISNKVIYKNYENNSKSESIFDNHIKTIETIDKNSIIAKNLITQLKSNKLIDFKSLDISTIKRTMYDNTNVILYTVHHILNNTKTLVYEYGNTYNFATLFTEKVKDINKYKLTNLSGGLLFSVDMNSDNAYGNWVIGTSNFGNIKRMSFGDCMNGAIASCAADWWCVAGLALYPVEVLGGMAISCALGFENQNPQ